MTMQKKRGPELHLSMKVKGSESERSGNVVIEERSAGNSPLVDYTRGNDLGESFQGLPRERNVRAHSPWAAAESSKTQSATAAQSLTGEPGIGGLLARTHNGEEVPGSTLANAFYHADGNGNVTCLILQNQQIAAKYLYDPFGNMLAMSGPLAGANKYRFSSKEWDDNAGLYYYLYRFYDPNLQRWPNRDPVTEIGFLTMKEPRKLPRLVNYKSDVLNRIGPCFYNHLLAGNEDAANHYRFVQNDPIEIIDLFGLQSIISYPRFPGFGPSGWEGAPPNTWNMPPSPPDCPCADDAAEAAIECPECIFELFDKYGGGEEAMTATIGMEADNPIFPPGPIGPVSPPGPIVPCAKCAKALNDMATDCAGPEPPGGITYPNPL